MAISRKIFEESNFYDIEGAVAKVYHFLKRNPTKAFTTREVEVGIKLKNNVIKALRCLRSVGLIEVKKPYHCVCLNVEDESKKMNAAEVLSKSKNKIPLNQLGLKEPEPKEPEPFVDETLPEDIEPYDETLPEDIEPYDETLPEDIEPYDETLPEDIEPYTLEDAEPESLEKPKEIEKSEEKVEEKVEEKLEENL